MEVEGAYILRRTERQTVNMPPIDRLSSLPDCIICHILSFLPTKNSVSTCILAKRWRFLWAYVPTLDFDCENGYTDFSEGKRFLDIVTKVSLFNKVQNMNTFRLSYKNICSDKQLEKCITSVIARNVQNLDLSCLNQFMLPRCIFDCKSLIDLRLHFCVGIPMTGDVSLPSLKKLRLDMVHYDSDKCLTHLLSGCPALEELIIDRIVLNRDMVCCYITSPTLTRLVLKSSRNFVDGYYTKAHKVKIDTPALRYLQLHDSLSEVLSVGPLNCLVEADVSLDCDDPIEGEMLYSRYTVEFVGRLCNVRCLKLSSGSVKVFDSALPALTIKFPNLIKLELAAHWTFLFIFLANADKLEVLTINEVDSYMKFWLDPSRVSNCLLSHLRSVTINQFLCIEPEFKFTRYLLNNAQVLERVEIYSQFQCFNLEKKFDALRRISMFQRASEACQVAFH